VADVPEVSVIIPSRQRRDALRRALTSLAREAGAPGFEVVVAVDGSTDGTIEMIDAFESPHPVRRVEAPGRGRAAACNVALAAARGEIVIILDDDMQVAEGFVERHFRHHPAGTRVCVLGAVPVELDGASTHAARYVKEKFGLHLARLSDPAHLNLPRSFYTGNASIRAEVLRGVGGFDESFGVYGNEDVELALRLRAGGVTLSYDPEALARQEYGKDLGGLLRDTVEKGRTTVMLAQAHPDVFPDLRLAAPDDSSRPWLAARSLLLSATRVSPAVTAATFALASALERIGLWRQPLFYRAVIDYAFWAGADGGLSESDNKGELVWLAGELRRGPIDLLLHG
jgi:GT2 family glycosyltransferase